MQLQSKSRTRRVAWSLFPILFLFLQLAPVEAKQFVYAAAGSGSNRILRVAMVSDTKQAWLGVWLNDVTPRLRRQYHLKTGKGAFIVDVVEDSPADKAGLRKHDVIVAVNGQPVDDADDLRSYLEDAEPGEQITLEVLRDGKKLTLQARLRSKPQGLENLLPLPYLQGQTGRLTIITPITAMLGIDAQDLNRDLARYFHLKEPKGVLVTDVDEDGPADKAGLKAGDVIVEIDDVEIEDTEHLKEILQDDYEPGDEVELTVIRDGKRITLSLELGGKSYNFWYGFLGKDRRKPYELWLRSWSTQPEELQRQLEEMQERLRDFVRREMRHQQENMQEQLQNELRSLRKELGELKKEIQDLKAELEKRTSRK